jgi:hypothetical protein
MNGKKQECAVPLLGDGMIINYLATMKMIRNTLYFVSLEIDLPVGIVFVREPTTPACFPRQPFESRGNNHDWRKNPVFVGGRPRWCKTAIVWLFAFL